MIGLCKVAKLDGEDGIKEQDYSLNAGRYVGVSIEDDGVDFKQCMTETHQELLRLHKEADALMEQISRDMREMGL